MNPVFVIAQLFNFALLFLMITASVFLFVRLVGRGTGGGKTKNKSSKVHVVELPADLLERLESRAYEAGMSREALLELLLQDYLDEEIEYIENAKAKREMKS